MSTLILAEHNGQTLNEAVRHAVTAAQAFNAPIHILVAGENVAEIAQQAAKISGVERVLTADAAHLAHALAEDVSNVLLSIAPQYDVILAAHASVSRNVLPRIAALLDVAMVSDVLEIKGDNTYVRAIYAGDILATVKSADSKQVLTVRSNYFDAAETAGNADISGIEVPAAVNNNRWNSETRIESELPELPTAKIVVSGGRSLGSAEKFNEVLTPLAKKLGAALGATRAAVDAGYAPNEIQVGQTGVTVAPELYFAVGISGAVQHTAGMKDSRVIVAINADPDAAIFQVADYGLVADLFETVPNLIDKI